MTDPERREAIRAALAEECEAFLDGLGRASRPTFEQESVIRTLAGALAEWALSPCSRGLRCSP